MGLDQEGDTELRAEERARWPDSVSPGSFSRSLGS